ncbi:hypothetical protein [Streptomyces sp. NPDC101234]|uniref:hypothetical protein n=1 Tax=Streptomyces sp. NPDC101234 TaxID=3366138 RepID=UPI00382BAFE2
MSIDNRVKICTAPRGRPPGAEFRALPDGLFECPAGHLLAPWDVDLDGARVWAVDASGVLGYVTDPDRALEVLGEGREMPDQEYGTMSSLRSAVEAFDEYAEAFQAGAAPVFHR